ncbi:hypothetical protein CM19_11125 [Candidatus Acidianus copahuensis]|uniref:Uncharacterized protein n=1 Tax=Candidatus Acidianus copahuensis TaxID=1160895 RepID=A0A031LLA9_9CREN|nr:hypothetical protein [Candidatus Acidianus copahuensis]EZQ02019.1 hypothetical protein CM19_11125 [Candidatus Acidianus copahuensis]
MAKVSKESLGIQTLRWAGLLGSTLWAGVHFDLTSAILPNPTATIIYRVFFGFVASLAIIAGLVFLQGIRKLYLPALAFYVIDLVLLVETRTLPALFVGKVLPINPYVEISIVLDVLLIVISALLWITDKE